MSTPNASGHVILCDELQWNAVRVFSATMVSERDNLGERITRWLSDTPDVTLCEVVVTQSSDQAFHCVSITVFYHRREAP